MLDKPTPDFTYFKSHWLHDFGPRFSHLQFDITKILYFPPEIGKIDLRLILPLKMDVICSDASSLRTANPGETEFAFHNSDMFLLNRLQKLVSMVRRKVAEKHDLLHLIPDDDIRTSSTPLPPDILKKHMFFLKVARLVLSGSETVESLASFYCLSKTNIRIWVSLLLNYGPKVFYEVDERSRFSEYTEDLIGRSHVTRGWPTVLCCARHRIFNRNTFKNIIRRYRRRNPPIPA